MNARFRTLSILVALVMVIILTMSFSPTLAASKPDNGELPQSSVSAAPQTDLAQEEVTIVDSQQPDPNSNGEPDLEPVNLLENGQIELEAGPSLQGAYDTFMFFSANVFSPYDSTTAWAYGNSGCIFHTGGSGFMEHTVQLPKGAEIDYVRLYFYDNDPVNDATLTFFAFDAQGNYESIATVSSSGAYAGYLSAGSEFFSHPVDNLNEALALRLSFGGATTNLLKICGVRIRYQYSPTAVFLPVINR